MLSTFAALSASFLLLSRFVVHPWNFSPVMTLFMKAGRQSPSSLWLISAALVLSDLILGFSGSLLFGYASYLVMFYWMKKKRRSWFALSVSGSFLFFALSNFGVWYVDHLYSHDLAGLVRCYTAALPFFGSTILGNLFYGFIFFEVLPRLESIVKPLRAR